jgi:hypothetical protein
MTDSRPFVWLRQGNLSERHPQRHRPSCDFIAQIQESGLPLICLRQASGLA